MKYIVWWVAIFSAILLLGLVIAAAVLLVRVVSADPALVWVPLLVLLALVIPTLAIAINWLQSHRGGPLDHVNQQPGEEIR